MISETKVGIFTLSGLVLFAARDTLVYFYSPTEAAQKHPPPDRHIRIGGLVETGSLKRRPDGLTVDFVVTDTAKRIAVVYSGLLPDLFKEGKGVVTQGKLGPDGVFRATEVLAKHDENYMPPEAAAALAKAHAEKAAKSVVGPAAAGTR